MFKESSNIVAKILSNSNIGLWAIEIEEGKEPRMYGDSTMSRLLGIIDDLTPEEYYRAWYDNIDTSYYGDVEETVNKMINGECAEVQYSWFHPRNGMTFVRCGGARDLDYTDGIRLEGCHRDISDLVRVHTSSRVTSKVLANANIGLWAIELDEGEEPRMYGNEKMLELLGVTTKLTPEELYHAWYDHIDPDYYDMVNDTVEHIIAGDNSEVQYPWNHPTLGTMYVRCGGVLNETYTRGKRLEGCHRDVSKLFRVQEKIEKMENDLKAANDLAKRASVLANTDTMTGTLNHRAFFEHANKLIKDNSENNNLSHVFFIDVDGLKQINDNFGHDEGDYCIKAVSKILTQSVDGKGIVGRLGGDEFSIVYTTRVDDDASEFRVNLKSELAKLNKTSMKDYKIDFSVGQVIIDGDSVLTAEEAVNSADQKMYDMKKGKKENGCVR